MTREWKPGDHVAFVGTSDPYTRLREGDTGVVRFVDDLGTVHVAWEPDGHMFGLVPGVDAWREDPREETVGCAPDPGDPTSPDHRCVLPDPLIRIEVTTAQQLLLARVVYERLGASILANDGDADALAALSRVIRGAHPRWNGQIQQFFPTEEGEQ